MLDNDILGSSLAFFSNSYYDLKKYSEDVFQAEKCFYVERNDTAFLNNSLKEIFSLFNFNLNNMPNGDFIFELLDYYAIDQNKKLIKLSVFERFIAHLAIAFSSFKELLILDVNYDFLTPEHQTVIRKYVSLYNNFGLSVLFITKDIDVAVNLSKKVYVLGGDKVIYVFDSDDYENTIYKISGKKDEISEFISRHLSKDKILDLSYGYEISVLIINSPLDDLENFYYNKFGFERESFSGEKLVEKIYFYHKKLTYQEDKYILKVNENTFGIFSSKNYSKPDNALLKKWMYKNSRVFWLFLPILIAIFYILSTFYIENNQDKILTIFEGLIFLLPTFSAIGLCLGEIKYLMFKGIKYSVVKKNLLEIIYFSSVCSTLCLLVICFFHDYFFGNGLYDDRYIFSRTVYFVIFTISSIILAQLISYLVLSFRSNYSKKQAFVSYFYAIFFITIDRLLLEYYVLIFDNYFMLSLFCFVFVLSFIISRMVITKYINTYSYKYRFMKLSFFQKFMKLN